MNWMNTGPWTERIQKHQLILWYFLKVPYLWNLLTKPLVNRVNLSPENLKSQSKWFIKSQMSQLWLVYSLPGLMVLCTPTGTGLIYDEKLFRGKTPSGATNLVRGGPVCAASTCIIIIDVPCQYFKSIFWVGSSIDQHFMTSSNSCCFSTSWFDSWNMHKTRSF